MKKITFYFTTMLFLFAFSWQGMAQYFTEGFENAGAFPAGWTLTNGTNDWAIDDGTDHGPGSAQEGTYSAFFNDYDYSSGVTADMISPSIDLTAATVPVIEFWYWDESGDDTVEVLASTDGVAYTSVGSTPASVTPWTKVTLDLSAYAGEATVTISFRGTSVYGYSNPHVDNIVVDEAPACPDVTNITNTNYADGICGISWGAVSGAAGYNFEIQLQGVAQGDAGAIVSSNIAGTSFNTTGLVDGTDYTVYVQTDCDAAGTANYLSYDFTFVIPPVNNDFAGATPITPSAEGTVCDASSTFVAWTAVSGVTDSGMDGTCNTTNTGLDVFYSWTADTDVLVWSGLDGGPGVIIRDPSGAEITCEQTLQTNSELSGWAIGDDLIIQVYDYQTADVDVSFCLIKKMTIPQISATPIGIDCTVDASFNVEVDVTTLGSASAVTVSDDQGSATQNTTDTGVLTFGPYADGTTVIFTIVSDDDATVTSSTDAIDFACSTTSIDELAAVGFEYYPNPVNSNLTVKANENISSIVIFNMLGQQVKQVNPSSLNAQIDMTNLTNGTYFVKATVGEKVGTFKIIKK